MHVIYLQQIKAVSLIIDTQGTSQYSYMQKYHLKNIVTLYQLSARCLSRNSPRMYTTPIGAHPSTSRLTVLAGYI